MRCVTWFLCAASLSACAPQAALPAQSPVTERPAPPSAWKQVEPGRQKQALVPEPVGVPAADVACQQLLEPPRTGCERPTSELDALARAMASQEPHERDRQLTCLEAGSAFAPGAIRALRAELIPECADVLALPLLEPRRADLARDVEDTLIALAASGRLRRLVQKAPELAAPFDRARFMDFFQTTLKPWIVTQAAAIHDLAAVGPRLSPYAKGVVAVEAGLADMRFVSVVRQVPLPKEMSDDAEVRDAYYAALDEALEPRKARGRDAALVGLRELCNEGIVFDPRVDRARALLSEVYSGRRIDALDRLLLPELGAAPQDTSERSLAAQLPSFYSGILLAHAPLDAPLLRALLERGLPKAFAARLAPELLDDPSKALLVRARFDRGRVYFRAQDFENSAKLSAVEKPTPEQALYHALSVALQNGPRDGSDLLLRGPQLPTGAAQVAELDHLVLQKSPLSALAAFDAAYLLGLAPPQNDPKFWDMLGKRFDSASRLLTDPIQKKNAREAGSAAKDTAKALRASSAPAPLSAGAR